MPMAQKPKAFPKFLPGTRKQTEEAAGNASDNWADGTIGAIGMPRPRAV
jgi:hypothetical protein